MNLGKEQLIDGQLHVVGDAAGAGRRVGYDDPSHFTREYKRLFGAPPLRHAARLRGTAWEGAVV